tara:strand:+ start:48 stop:341 length:294 start_codon:yes stop_codon:yes gene_type:complete
MAYKGFKGCGPRGLGSSPIKQDADNTHKRLAEIKLTRERLNKKPKLHSIITLPKPRALGGSGALQLLGGVVGMRAGAFNLAKKKPTATPPEAEIEKN